MPNERPRVVVIKERGGHGCVITVILAIIAWPLAILYWVLRALGWAAGSLIDWLAGGRWRRR